MATYSFASNIFFSSLIIPRAGRVACAKITGRLVWENSHSLCGSFSTQEALGYESRGREAKRRETTAMEEKALWWYTSPNGKGERQYRGLWRGIKRPAIRERRIKRHGVDCQSSMRDQNRPGSLASWLPLCRIVTISLQIPAFSHFRSLQGIHYRRYRCVYTRFTCEYRISIRIKIYYFCCYCFF